VLDTLSFHRAPDSKRIIPKVVDWLEAITDFSVPESTRRVLETTTPFGDASSLYELQRPPSPMRLY